MSNADEIRAKTACFTGHRELKEPISEIERRLMGTVESLVQRGCRYFGAGGARGFDALAAETVLKLKAAYPHIHLILVLPFDEQYQWEKGWTTAEIAQYHRLKKRASKVVVLSDRYAPGIYYRRNRHLIDHSSVCVAYMAKTNSGTGYTVNYARERGLEVINIALV